MTTIGIDIGGRSHAVARCRDGATKAEREILRVSQSRAGFAALDAWLERQVDAVTLVTMESSGHYWMPLASHLRRRDVPVAVVNPLAAKYFARSRLARTKSDPADARSLAEMGMRDQPVARDPLAGAELRQAARFAMALVEEQAKVCQRLIRLVELGFPELGELFDDPTCRTAREVLRIAPTARAAIRRRTSTLANANAGPGHRRLGQTKAERSAQAQSLIYIDDLTKLYNGRYLNVVLDREMKRSERYRNFFCVLFMDIDFFKRVNDAHGHLVGSRVLVEVGAVLRACVRDSDTVVRYGGDEFVVLLVETNADEAMIVAERMRKMIEAEPFVKETGLAIRLTISIGIAAFPEHANTKQTLLNLADQAMYRGKESTRNVVYLAHAQNVP